MKKSLTALCICALTLICIFALPTQVQAATEGDYEYSVTDGKATITDYTGNGGNITIPATLDGYPVTELADYIFNGDKIGTLIVSEGIETIGGVWGCPVEVYIPASATKIENGAFGSTNLEKIVVAEGNTKYHVVQNCLVDKETKTLLQTTKEGIIPADDSVTTIGDEIFNGMHLDTLYIPDTITDIAHYAFFGCTADHLYIGKGFTESTSRFYHCRINESITVSEENPIYHSEGNCWIETESKTLIAGCNNSRIPDDGSIEVIGRGAFADCSSLTALVIPEGIKQIGDYAFQGSHALQKITIPASVEGIGGGCFEYCAALSEIIVDQDNLTYHCIDNCLIKTAEKTLIAGCKNSIIPADGSVERIAYAAFYGLGDMYYLNIPEGIKEIGDSAFCGTKLTILSLPATLQTIRSENFGEDGSPKYIIYGGSEEDREEIAIQESWPGQNAGFTSAQWYYNGESPFPDATLSVEPVTCTKLIDVVTWRTSIGNSESYTWFEYIIDPQITVTYSDGSTFTGNTKEIEEKIGFPVAIFHNQTRSNQWDTGAYTARLCCMDQMLPVEVTIVDHPIEKIEIRDVTIVENTYGYEYDGGYKYSFSPQYTITFKDGTVREMEFSEWEQYFEVAGKRIRIDTNIYELQNGSSWVTGQSYEVTGTLLDVTDTFTVTIREKALTNIAVTAKPKKLVYTVGEKLDITGMIVTAYYDNQTIARIVDYEVSGYDPSQAKDQFVTVSYGGKQTSFKVSVHPIKVTGITLDFQEVSLITLNSKVITATVYPADATNKAVIWTSNNTAVASVNSDGVISAHREGVATITATTQDGNYYDSCVVYVVCNHKNLVYQEKLESDCVNDGIADHYLCANCDNLYELDKRTQATEESLKILATGHSWGSGAVTKPATCKETGVRTYTCSVCKDTKAATIAKLTTHTYTNNCDNSCNVCGKTRTVGAHKYTNNADTTCNVCNAKAYPGGNILYKENGKYYHIKDRKKVSDTALVKHTNGKYYYVNKGVVDFTKTGLVKHTNGKYYYVNKGVVDFTKTGLVKHTDGNYYYVKKGVKTDSTLLVKHTNGKYYYVQKGKVNFSKTALIKHTDGNYYYVKSGVKTNSTLLFKHTDGKWYYVQSGKVNFAKTGLVKHTDGKYYYVLKGKIDFSKTALVKHTDGNYYYVKKGVKTNSTLLFKHTDGKWYYVNKGVVDFAKTGLVKHTDGKYYYVVKGKIDFSKTALVKHTDGKYYYVKSGVKTNSTLLFKHTDGKWYYVNKGVVDFAKTGLVKHTDGKYYYVVKGKIDFSQTTLAKHTDGKWYYVNKGAVDFSKNGKVSYNGKYYTVKKGVVV